ncbi:hypothetical protein [Mycobacterium sp. SMC-4]|uniref:hypothetical protein n=1 Tax=Mycobacterium sp. SMC-4 TaxID=2857059 RepID=UPI0021B1A88A|nr:hypothetical protein [Mycobacterium sp. SMC-4]UXA16045.1 hypothetical protein KXD98_14335 [Mycobacterium sp. SMC-4]
MSAHRMISGPKLRRRAVTAAASCCAALLVAPPAWGAPNSDSRGYLDSTARCAAPDSAVVFGYTETSRIAICESPGGALTYRGVRVRDGARLITSATRSADGAFTATRNGVEYLVTAKSLVISTGEKVIRDEPMLDFRRAGASTTPESPATATTTPTTTAPTTPLPPPLPAEVGGGDR